MAADRTPQVQARARSAQLRERALGILEDMSEQASKVYAVASAGRAFVGDDAVTEQHLFEVIQDMLASTSLQTTLKQVIDDLAAQAEVHHG